MNWNHPALLACTLLLATGTPTTMKLNAQDLGATPLSTTTTTTTQPSALIPRKTLFGNPDRTAVRISPDGKHISYLAPREGVLNVWVAPTDEVSKAKPVTASTRRGIQTYYWAYNSQQIIYTQDEGGNENWNIHVADIDTGKTTNLTPNPAVAARVQEMSDKFPDEILVMINDRMPAFHDLWRINLKTGEKKQVWLNPGTIESNTVGGVVTDEDFTLRFVIAFTPDGGQEIYQPVTQPEKQDGTPGFESFAKISMQDAMTTSPESFDRTGELLYMTDSRGRNTGAFKMLNLKTGDEKVLAEDARADAVGSLFDPKTKVAQAVEFNYQRSEWKVVDPAIEPDFAALKAVPEKEGFGEADLQVAARTLDDSKWIVAFLQDDGPVRYYLYDRASKNAKFLFSNRDDLKGLKLAKLTPLVIKSRDGMDLVSYLTLPVGSDSDGDCVPDKPLPLVLLVHGGPWARDGWGFNPMHQWLANRGYAVLSVNYRGSTGFGKDFINAANREWSGKMHNDLLDAVDAMIKQKVADPSKVAIMGGSYGGYATLVGLTFTPDTFACGVDIVGPSNLNTLLATIPPYWKPAVSLWKTRMGDFQSPEGKAFLDKCSPLTRVQEIKRPLLIGQGANDPRVKQAESDQIVAEMQAKKIPVTYVLYPDEGHGFARPENRMSFFAVAEQFLAEHLGGQSQPIGDDFKGSTIKVPAGENEIPTLSAALTQK